MEKAIERFLVSEAFCEARLIAKVLAAYIAVVTLCGVALAVGWTLEHRPDRLREQPIPSLPPSPPGR